MRHLLIDQSTNHEGNSVDEFEAMDVLSYLLCSFAPGCGCVYRLGNGEYTVRMRLHGGYFLWNWRDACVFLQLVEDQGRALDAKRRVKRVERTKAGIA